MRKCDEWKKLSNETMRKCDEWRKNTPSIQTMRKCDEWKTKTPSNQTMRKCDEWKKNLSDQTMRKCDEWKSSVKSNCEEVWWMEGKKTCQTKLWGSVVNEKNCQIKLWGSVMKRQDGGSDGGLDPFECRLLLDPNWADLGWVIEHEVTHTGESHVSTTEFPSEPSHLPGMFVPGIMEFVQSALCAKQCRRLSAVLACPFARCTCCERWLGVCQQSVCRPLAVLLRGGYALSRTWSAWFKFVWSVVCLRGEGGLFCCLLLLDCFCV